MFRYEPLKAEYKAGWQVHEAKAMLSEVIKEAAAKPQVITVRGKDTAVVLSIEAFQKLARPQQTLFEFIQNSPLRDFKLDLPRRTSEKMRDFQL